MAKRLFSVDGEEVKHELRDEGQQERTHPVFYSLSEQWEKTIACIQDLPARTALVRAPGKRVAQIKTIEVRDGACSREKLAEITRQLARQSGEPAAGLAVERTIANEPERMEVVDWEQDPHSAGLNEIACA